MKVSELYDILGKLPADIEIVIADAQNEHRLQSDHVYHSIIEIQMCYHEDSVDDIVTLHPESE